MFKGKAQSNSTGTTSTSTATPVPTGTANKPAASSNGPAAARTGSGAPSIISSDLRIEGNLFSEGDVQIDGEVVGDINSRTLTLGEKSVVRGSVSAETVRLCGKVNGEVKASTVVMTKTARVSGDILHDSLAIEAGAYIDGHCKRLEPKGAESGEGVSKSSSTQPTSSIGSQSSSQSERTVPAAAVK